MSYRDERRKFEADVRYEVWRSGGNPDTVDQERVEESYYGGSYPDEAAHHELRIQRRNNNNKSEDRP